MNKLRPGVVLLAAFTSASALAAGSIVALRLAEDAAQPAAKATAGASATPSPGESPLPPPSELDLAPVTGPGPTAPGVAATLAGPLGVAALGVRVTGYVVDAASATVLFEQHPAQPVAPASTAKLLTAVAALHTLGPDTTLATRAVAGAPPGADGAVSDLALVGGGDATLASPAAHPRYPEPARLDALAKAVAASGVRRVSRLLVDATLFSEPRLGPEWKPTYVTEGSVSPITALMVDGGRVTPGKDKRYADPDLAAGRLFIRLLRGHGVSVPDDVQRGTASATGATVGQVTSAPMSSLVERMLAESDNELAESLGHLVALKRGQPATFAGAVTATGGALAELGRPGAMTGLLDNSGLSPANRITTPMLAAVLALVLEPRNRQLRSVLSGLPVSGYDGTMATRFDEPESRRAAGWVRAKTGSLDYVSTLAGVVLTRSGHLLVFALAADRLPTRSVAKGAAALDAAVAALRGCGCTGG